MSKLYAGIGSRSTPETVLKLMMLISAKLETLGYVLRSGGAPGADTAFELGVRDPKNKEIYLPTKNWRGNPSPYYDVSDSAIALAARYHPNFKALTPFTILLMGRTVYQVLGRDLKTPVSFVVCYTPDGCDMVTVHRSPKTGGTGQALSIAHDHHIPIFNLYHKDTVKLLEDFVTKQQPVES